MQTRAGLRTVAWCLCALILLTCPRTARPLTVSSGHRALHGPLNGTAERAREFVFGTASASWQYEGAVHVDGRGPTIWDEFCEQPGPSGSRCYRNESATVAVDQYNLTRLEDDILRMKELSTTAYRLSLAWSRILPSGEGAVEARGVAHYRAVLGMLRAAGIEPYVTLFHFDLPLALERRGGWLNASTVEAFAAYAEVCFREFGDLVDHWLTVNEPHTIATAGYLYGVAAPGRCSDRTRCWEGDGATEPYLAAHSLLLAHARAADIYRRSYQTEWGSIALVLSADWTEPWAAGSAADAAAARRRQQFQVGWFADPLTSGDYPEVMRRRVGARLPRFSAAESRLLRGSVDYFALNHYTSRYGRVPAGGCAARANESSSGWDEDQCCEATAEGPDGRAIGPLAGSDWLYAVPWGLRKLLPSLAADYPNLPILITENGCDDNTTTAAAEGAGAELDDAFRWEYLSSYLAAVAAAVAEDGVDVRGYFVWSLLDNFEWADGFSKRFGMYRVDDEGAEPSLQRRPKQSVRRFARLVEQWQRRPPPAAPAPRGEPGGAGETIPRAAAAGGGAAVGPLVGRAAGLAMLAEAQLCAAVVLLFAGYACILGSSGLMHAQHRPPSIAKEAADFAAAFGWDSPGPH